MKAMLVLEDGRAFECRSFTGPGEAAGEVVFNTGMTGYQEILTDPSYTGQMVAMTYPLMGNYGINPEDVESDGICVSAFIMREYEEFPSNFRSTQSLAEYLKAAGVPGIDELDTRALTRHIREAGAMRAIVSTRDLNPDSLAARAREIPAMTGRDMVSSVTSSVPYFWKNNERLPILSPILSNVSPEAGPLDSTIWREKGGKYRVVAMDFGIKYNILRCLDASGCEVLVVPARTSPETIRNLKPDGIFLSNGPGDPAPVTFAVETVRKLMGHVPMFGICLGIQLIGLALGAKTYKLKFGHHGVNQPVQNLSTRRVEITSQNHGFAVDIETLNQNDIEITHVNLNDNTLEGFRHKNYPLFAVQYHPEAAPGPHDSRYLFDEFTQLMRTAS